MELKNLLTEAFYRTDGREACVVPHGAIVQYCELAEKTACITPLTRWYHGFRFIDFSITAAPMSSAIVFTVQQSFHNGSVTSSATTLHIIHCMIQYIFIHNTASHRPSPPALQKPMARSATSTVLSNCIPYEDGPCRL